MSNDIAARIAGPEDFARLIAMVRDFYVEDCIPYQPELVEPGLRAVLGNPSLGAVLMLSSDDLAEVGYVTLGWCFSVEQGGRFVLLDELYLAPSARGRGWGRQALAVARDWAAGQGAAVIRLEVNHHNAKAKRLYLSAGYRDDERDILTLSLNGQAGGLHS
ncbi:GNAT family N-acetyltransferase [Stenotrophomonas sp. Iso1]|uniref:GNAT family N-acetyltransferase n=1 Tax=Stenotrophomonas sp. Iso1 TaxID=2977283 RepID=UPI0022B7D0AA|nr:GNAT family N-acetyltransferase [Stenotrophomonas sp. Iso1]